MSLSNLALPLLEFRFMPDAASTVSSRVDALYFYLLTVSTVFGGLVFLLVTVFAIKYRRSRYPQAAPDAPHHNLKLEITWIAIPFVLVMIMFGWGAKLYVDMRTPPADATEVFVVGRQWMWKLQHSNGRREINELHMPVGRPIRLRMISEDVIHSFYVPAFRVKQDVLPGYYTTTWFEATKAGEYHLFCAEYCGTQHSSMIGKVVVMEPDDYQRWLNGPETVKTMAELGQDLFTGRGSCLTCHNSASGPRGPDLGGVFGKTVQLKGGGTVTADENYLRESILRPAAKIAVGYENLMPPYEGQLTEEEVLHLIAYMKTLAPGQVPMPSPATQPAAAPGGAQP